MWFGVGFRHVFRSQDQRLLSLYQKYIAIVEKELAVEDKKDGLPVCSGLSDSVYRRTG